MQLFISGLFVFLFYFNLGESGGKSTTPFVLLTRPRSTLIYLTARDKSGCQQPLTADHHALSPFVSLDIVHLHFDLHLIRLNCFCLEPRHLLS
jgi:hypothetical protein